MPVAPLPSTNPPGIQVTALDLITAALRQINVVPAGETPHVTEAQDALAVLNQILEAWNTDRLSIYTISAQTFTLQDGKAQYTIGGPGLGADLDAQRPVFIQNANIIITTQTPNIRIPLYLLNDDEWADIRVRNITSTIPQQLYNDGAFPLSTLNFWGIPSGTMDLELFTWQQLTLVTALDSVLAFPPGYQRALKFNLAVELAPEYGPEAIALAPVKLAQDSLAAIKSLNSSPPLMECDAAAMPTLWTSRKRFFNIFTG